MKKYTAAFLLSCATFLYSMELPPLALEESEDKELTEDPRHKRAYQSINDKDVLGFTEALKEISSDEKKLELMRFAIGFAPELISCVADLLYCLNDVNTKNELIEYAQGRGYDLIALRQITSPRTPRTQTPRRRNSVRFQRPTDDALDPVAIPTGVPSESRTSPEPRVDSNPVGALSTIEEIVPTEQQPSPEERQSSRHRRSVSLLMNTAGHTPPGSTISHITPRRGSTSQMDQSAVARALTDVIRPS